MTEVQKDTNGKIDKLEAAMVANGNLIDCPVMHRFTPGLYTREIFMPKGSMVTSMIHKTKHQFIVLEGVVSVFSENDGEQLIEAPYVGVTLPNTRRVLYIHEDCRWITVHATDVSPVDETPQAYKEAVDKIEKQIIEPYINELVGGILRNNILSQQIDNQ